MPLHRPGSVFRCRRLAGRRLPITYPGGTLPKVVAPLLAGQVKGDPWI